MPQVEERECVYTSMYKRACVFKGAGPSSRKTDDADRVMLIQISVNLVSFFSWAEECGVKL
jgi:hypothetical protein